LARADSLRLRLPLLISALIAVSLIAFLSVSYQQVQRELLRAGDARAQAVADQLANLLVQSAQQQLGEARRIAQDPAVRGYLAARGEAKAAAARERLGALSTAGQPPAELWDETGKRLIVAAPTKSDRPVPALPPARAPSAEAVGPFLESGDTIYWEVAANASAEPAAAGVPAAARGFVVSRRVLSRASNSEAIRKLVGAGAVIKLGNVSGGVWSDLSKPVPPPGVDVRPGAIVDNASSGGERLIGWAATVRGTPWLVATQLPRAAIVAPARAYALRMLIVTVVLVLAAAGGSWALASRITTPLGQLTDAAEAIAQGRFEHQVATTRRDEIGRLAIAFEAMATQVQSARQELEARVEERTRAVGELNAQLEGRVESLNTLTGELEAFSYSVSHDLRAPLRHISGFATLLQKSAGGTLDPASARHLQTIVEAAGSMGRLIDDLLAFSRMGRAEMLTRRVELDEIVREVVHDADQGTAGRRINWTTTPLPAVAGDQAMLRLVFANLVSNAVKYTSERAVAEIEIGALPSVNGDRVVYVRDNGVGFDMAYVGKLFGVFQRLHAPDQFAGTGIGLANVRRIVQRHGGRAWAEGAVDSGATFFVSLPAGGPADH
jgi:signal transduction histidine kinase